MLYTKIILMICIIFTHPSIDYIYLLFVYYIYTYIRYFNHIRSNFEVFTVVWYNRDMYYSCYLRCGGLFCDYSRDRLRREFLFLFQSFIICNLYDRVIPLPRKSHYRTMTFVVGDRHTLSWPLCFCAAAVVVVCWLLSPSWKHHNFFVFYSCWQISCDVEKHICTFYMAIKGWNKN